MAEFTLNYREVIPDQSFVDNWKEIILTTGGTQSTLQDIKVPERANGFYYEDCTKPHLRNRFIYWRINYDILELIEHSLDINLTGNRIRYQFSDTPILDGVSIHETYENVIVLVPTVCSVHRLIFPHPDRLHRQDHFLGTHPDLAASSIFAKALAIDAKKPSSFHVFSNPSTAGDQLPNLAASYLSSETDEAFFVLAYPSTELLLIKKLPDSPQVSITELKGEYLMPKFLSGIAQKFLYKNSDTDNILSVLFYVMHSELFILTLSRFGHLKFWSCSKEQCVAVIDVLAESDYRDQLQTAVLKKPIDFNHSENILVVYLSFPSYSQFFIFNLSIINQQIKGHHTQTFNCPANDLIDFAVQAKSIWSIWRGEEGNCALYTISLRTRENPKWVPVILEQPYDPDAPQYSPIDSNPRQIYLQHIFYPGRFPLQIIQKALSIFSNSPDLKSSHLTVSALKQQICMAVDNEVARDPNIIDEHYLESIEWCWKKFYTCCIEYNIANSRPLGLMLLPNVSGAIFLKNSSFSILRPLDILEHMTTCSDIILEHQLIDFGLFVEDIQLCKDVIGVFQIIAYLEQQVNESFILEFEKELLNLRSPDEVMNNLLEKVINIDQEFYAPILHMVSKIQNLYHAIHQVLELLRNQSTLAHPDNEIKTSEMYHFSSQLGISILASCLRQQSQIRFQICWSLLLICSIFVKSKKLEDPVRESIRTICVPEIAIFTRCNFVMLWFSQLPALVNFNHETTLQRLSSLKLPPVFNLNVTGNVSLSLLELFIASTGGFEARRAFARVDCREDSLAHWHWSLLQLLNHIRHTLCPLSGVTVLEEWLLSSGQHLWLQEYVRLLKWCEWNCYTREFLVACSFLMSGENYKACKLFNTAVNGVLKETFFIQRMLKSENDDPTNAYINYYLKVIQLLELHKARDFVIDFANKALGIQDQNDTSRATFSSKNFVNHLALRHYNKAFDSLNDDPNMERKKDNLRNLVKTLLDEKKFDVISSFIYGNLEEFFTEIILTRARGIDGINNVFYDFLYCYHVNRSPPCYRLAASAMYEQAYRLSNYTNTVKGLDKQVKCYLAAKNVLQLTQPEYAWVLRPAEAGAEDETVILEPRAGSNDTLQVLKIKRQIEVVNVDMIRRELRFASARLKLANFDPNCSTNITTVVELVTLLNNAGLFKTAFEVCKEFNLPYISVIESLTKQCVLMSEQEDPTACNWLFENDLQDLPANRDNIVDIVWRLLQNYLNKYEEPKMTTLHYAVCKKIISMNVYIPFWLLSSYKARNSAEVLRLLHGAGRLEEAFDVANGLLAAALLGKESYGFKQPLTVVSPEYCLPLYGIRQLIEEFEMQNTKNRDKPYLEEYQELKKSFEKYVKTSMMVSNQKCSKLSTGTIKKTSFLIN